MSVKKASPDSSSWKGKSGRPTAPPSMLISSSSLPSKKIKFSVPSTKLAKLDKEYDEGLQIGKALIGTKTTFMTLPAEIRLVIYDHLFENPRIVLGEKTLIGIRGYLGISRQQGFQVNILKINKTIRAEALSVLRRKKIMLEIKTFSYTRVDLGIFGCIPAMWRSQVECMTMPSRASYRQVHLLNIFDNLKEFRYATRLFDFRERRRPSENSTLEELAAFIKDDSY